MFVAFKEIRRSLGRFSLLTLAVALLVLLLLFFQAVAGTLTSGLTGGLESSSAQVFVYDQQARSNPATSVLRPGAQQEIAAVGGVAATSPIGLSVFTARLIGSAAPGDGSGGAQSGGAQSGGAQSGGAELDVQLVGGDPSGPSVPAKVADGRLPKAPGEALFSGSAFDTPIDIGRKVAVEGMTFTVVGSADDAAFNVLPTLYVPFEDYVKVSQERAGSPVDVPPSLIGVTVADGAEPAEVAQRLNESVDGIEALDRADAVAALPGVGQITQSFTILYLLLYIVVALVTGVFFLILTVQKEDALVLLRAVGAGSRDVITSVLIQVLVVVGLGALIGSAVTAGLLALSRDVFGAGLSPSTTAATVGLIVVIGLVASVGAVRRVLAIDPVRATSKGGR
ncbi:ABC transporter permease [Candidatus Microthrix parvicella]|uniref:ABC transporter permease n=1 Tax=Candidatus Neomicrothrix parvicella TaxID=41950 RepID=UPI00035F8A68|nr:ABC transporter permease [Candidatus Microthrix parvicella]